jgi:hypothetical protein
MSTLSTQRLTRKTFARRDLPYYEPDRPKGCLCDARVCNEHKRLNGFEIFGIAGVSRKNANTSGPSEGSKVALCRLHPWALLSGGRSLKLKCRVPGFMRLSFRIHPSIDGF